MMRPMSTPTVPAPVPLTEPSPLVLLQMDHAWKWFSFHADQRTKMFSFMLAALGVLAGGAVTLIDKQIYPLAAWLSICGAVLALAFFFLDRRNKRLYEVALDALIRLEQNHVYGAAAQGLASRIQHEDQRHGLWSHATHGKHRFWMPLLIALFGALFLAMGVHSLQQVAAAAKPATQAAAALAVPESMAPCAPAASAVQAASAAASKPGLPASSPSARP